MCHTKELESKYVFTLFLIKFNTFFDDDQQYFFKINKRRKSESKKFETTPLCSTVLPITSKEI